MAISATSRQKVLIKHFKQAIKHSFTPLTFYITSMFFAGYWIFGAQFCDTWVAFDVMCSTASILNLCAISMDRYIHIKDPLR